MPLALELDNFNRERRELTRISQEEVSLQINSGPSIGHLLLAYGTRFSPGIIGLLASRLVEKHYRPAIVVAIEGDLGRGSARSIPEFNITSALEECQDLLIQFGGHPRAAGFTILSRNIIALRKRLQAIAKRHLAHLSPRPTINIDAHVRLSSLNEENLRFFQNLAPYGEANPTPIFITKGVKVMEALRIGAHVQHMKFRLKQGDVTWDAVAFGHADTWQGNANTLDVVYSVGLNQWRGRSNLRMVIQDLRPAKG